MSQLHHLYDSRYVDTQNQIDTSHVTGKRFFSNSSTPSKDHCLAVCLWHRNISSNWVQCSCVRGVFPAPKAHEILSHQVLVVWQQILTTSFALAPNGKRGIKHDHSSRSYVSKFTKTFRFSEPDQSHCCI